VCVHHIQGHLHRIERELPGKGRVEHL
jgi:hypothetical protein